MRRTLLALTIFGLLLLPGRALATSILVATDQTGNSTYDAGTGVFATDATVSGGDVPASLAGATLHLRIQLDGAETAGTTGTRFVGALAGADLWIEDGGAPLLTAEVNFADVTNVTGTFNFTTFQFEVDSITLGGLDPAAGQSAFSVTGGSEAGSFSENGSLLLLLDNLNPSGTPAGSVFGQNFSSDARIETQLAPEPGTFLLVGGSLMALGAWRRRRARD